MEQASKYIVAIEIGNTRTKVGWKDCNNPDQQYQYGIQFSKSFLKPQDKIADNFFQFLQGKQVNNIERIIISCAGKLDTEKGLIINGQSLNYKSNRPFRKYPLIQNLKNKFNIQEIYLIHDSYSITLGTLVWSSKILNFDQFPLIILSLGTYPAIAFLNQKENGKYAVKSLFSREIFDEEHKMDLTEYLCKKNVTELKFTPEQYTHSAVKATQILQKCFFEIEKVYPKLIIICGGLASIIIDSYFSSFLESKVIIQNKEDVQMQFLMNGIGNYLELRDNIEFEYFKLTKPQTQQNQVQENAQQSSQELSESSEQYEEKKNN